MKNKIIMITGATGVIGTHFLWRLTGMGCTIYALHNRDLTKYHMSLTFPDVIFMQGNLTDSTFSDTLPMADIIIHAATYSSPSLFTANPIETIQLNTSTTIELLNKLKDKGKFLFISSSEVYSGLKNDFFSETQIGTTTTEHPRACYIESKRCGEAICINSGKDVKIARLGYVYGDGTRSGDGRVLYDFVDQALVCGGITGRGTGSNKRAYCYATDAIQMMWNILNSGKQVIYNIGGTEVITIRELSMEIAKLVGAFSISVGYDEDDGSPSSSALDMYRYNSEFGKYQYTTLKKGLEKVIKWQRHY